MINKGERGSCEQRCLTKKSAPVSDAKNLFFKNARLIESLWREAKSIFSLIRPEDFANALIAIYVIERKMIGRHCGDLGDKLSQYLSVTQFIRASQEKNINCIEIGTLFGGSCLMKLFAMRDLQVDGKVVCIDPMSGYYTQSVDPSTGLAVNAQTLFKNIELFGFPKEKVELRQFYSKDPRAIKNLKEKKYATVMIDGDHSFDGVEYDFNRYSEFTHNKGFILIDDYAEPEWPDITLFVEKFRDSLPICWNELGVLGTSLILGQKIAYHTILQNSDLCKNAYESCIEIFNLLKLRISKHLDSETQIESFAKFIDKNLSKSRKERLPIRLGHLYFKIGKLNDSETEFRKALSANGLHNKEKFDALIGLGSDLLKQNKIGSAQEAFEQAIALDDSEISTIMKLSAMSHLGQCYTKLGKNISAEEIYKKALCLENLDASNKFRILINIGDIHLKKGEIISAQEIYEKALYLENISENLAKKASIAIKKCNQIISKNIGIYGNISNNAIGNERNTDIKGRFNSTKKNIIELLNPEIVNQNEQLVESFRKLSQSLGLVIGWHYLLDLTWIASQLPNPKGMTILDAGGGMGILQWWLVERGAKVISVDRDKQNISENFYKRFQIGIFDKNIAPYTNQSNNNSFKSAGEVIFYNCDLTCLSDVKTNSIDAIVSVSALEHNSIEGMEKAVSELERLLEPGGLFLATVSASKNEDWYHSPSKGWCLTETTLAKIFSVNNYLSNFTDYDKIFADLKNSSALKDNLDPFYFKSGDNGMPWGVWNPQYQPVGIRKIKSNNTNIQNLYSTSHQKCLSLKDVKTNSYKFLAKYKNLHDGQRCIVIGNGPSLSNMDLSFLNKEITFGLNRIYLMFDKWDFTPTYYVSVNPLVIEQSAKEIQNIPSIKFLSLNGLPYIKDYRDMIFLQSLGRPHFSLDPRKGIWEGYTVTFVAMQLAYFMGFNEVILIGVDHYFKTSGSPNAEVISEGKDPNHFHPDYFGKGIRWNLPDLKNSELAYSLAKDAFENDGRRIVDATLNGKLQVFPKIDYTALIRKYQNIDKFGIRNISEITYLNSQGEILFAEGKLQLAEQRFQNVLKLSPNNAMAFNNLGVLYHQKGKHDQALECYKNAISIQPENITFLKNIADFKYLMLGKVEEALQIYITILKTHPEDEEVLLRLGKICLDLQKLNDAKYFFERILEIDPSNNGVRGCLDRIDLREQKSDTLNGRCIINDIHNKTRPRRFNEQNRETITAAEANSEHSRCDSLPIRIKEIEPCSTSANDEEPIIPTPTGNAKAVGSKSHNICKSVMQESSLAHEWLDELKGIEIGPSMHNPFGLNTRNVGLPDEIYEREQIARVGKAAKLDIIARADNIPLTNESEDFVLSSHVIEHCPDFIRTMFEWYRIIKRDGYIFLIVPHPDAAPSDVGKPLTRWQHLFSDYVNEQTPEKEPEAGRFGHCHYHVFSFDRMQNFVKQVFDDRLLLVASQKIDDKVGNGFTLVYQKTKALRDAFPWKMNAGKEVIDVEQTFAFHRDDILPQIDTEIRVTALISAYNSEKYMVGCLQDLTGQTLYKKGELEIIVVDSGSQQEEAKIVKEFQDKFSNIQYIRTENRESIYRAWNRGIRASSGKYITNANTDDRHRRDALERLAEELENNLGIGLVYADVFVTNFANQVFGKHIHCGYHIRPEFTPEIMLSGCHMGPQPMWRKSIHEKVGYFSTDYQSAGDYDFWCRVALQYQMKHVPEFMGLYYENPDGFCNSQKRLSNAETASIKNKYSSRFPAPKELQEYINNYQYSFKVPDNRYVNICMVTYNRLDFTKQAIASILKNTRYPHVITVVDNNSKDGTREYLIELNQKGVIKNLILLEENIGVAKASNLARQQEPDAAYYLKYDNDIVIQKRDWLMNMVKVIDSIPQLGAIGYNFEPKSYSVEKVNGYQIRIKRDANIGGACYLIPKRVEKKLGYWCEDYGLYGEEDGDYSLRLRLAGYCNAYMEDENVGIHLPGGKAALIDLVSKRGISSPELEKEYEYRTWKDSRRQELQKPGGILQRNVLAYQNGIRSLYVPHGEFQGKLGPNVQVFKQNGFISFLSVSGNICQSEMGYINQWLNENNLNHNQAEKYSENGREALRIMHAPSGAGANTNSNRSVEFPSLAVGLAGVENRSVTDQSRTKNPAAAVTASIIIPVFNQWEYTRNCIKVLYEVTGIQGDFEVIVVDNASTDNTHAFLEEAAKKYSNFSFIRNQRNFGFARACNQGAEHSNGYYLIFLNNDTLPQSGWLDEMIKAAEQDSLVGVVGSRLLYPGGTIQHAGVYFNEHGISYHAFRSAPGNHPPVLATRETPAVTGACILMPKQLFKHLGGFNEDYHMYVEDVDLCLRTWDAGFKVLYCAESVLTHFESASIKDVNRRDALVREAWNQLHKSWQNKWPPILQELKPENTSRKMILNSDPKVSGYGLKALDVLWHAPIFDPSGYADEARNFILQLQKQSIKPAVREIGRRSEAFRNGLSEKERRRLDEAIAQRAPKNFISIVQFPAYAFERIPQALYHIGRTTFETDGLPPDWIQKCNLMDEIWVPSEFNMQTFKAAGVTSKLFKIPEGVDSKRLKPDLDVLEIPGSRGVVFLSIFEWIYRKGWDVLLKSWAEAFGPDDAVSLVLRTYPMNVTDDIGTKKEIEQRIDRFLEVELKKSRQEVAPIIVLADQLNDHEIARLYNSVSAYVLPSRGEGWGRTQMEAMASGLPVLSTRWSGNLEFMNDHNSLLIDIEGLSVINERAEIPFYRGQNWAEPSAEHLSKLMREVVENPTMMEKIGHRARLDIERYWDWEKIAGIVAKRLHVIESELNHPMAKTEISYDTCRVRWEGSQFVNHSLALVNRELCIELAGRHDVELSLIPFEPHEFGPEEDPGRFGLIEERIGKPLSGAADFHVRHQWPPNLTPPPEGHWIVIQPWEFGALPLDWIKPLLSEVDEIWAYTRYVRDVYINSGIPGAKVHVIPLGINYGQFHPGAPPLNLNTEKQFKFLFVGGTIRRKGIDVLLSAYTEAFSAEDDVCLVIKDMGGKSFYRGQNASQIIEDIKKNPAAPEILYLTETLTTDQIAGLYTSCDCLVHPYRGEGFGLPVAEAMACGMPVIVTKGGACDDFCSEESAYFIDSTKRPVQLDGHVLSAPAWLLEPDRAHLIDRLRFVYEHPGQAKEMGALAARQIRKKVDWKMSTDLIIKRLRALRSKPIRRFPGSLDHKAAQAYKTPQEIYQTIQQSMKNKKHEEVIAALEMLKESYPQFALAYNDLGVLYYTAGNKEKARHFYEKAVELAPDNMVFQKNLADFYFVELGRIEDALRIYLKLLESNPTDAETLLIAGHICVSLHKFEDACVFYKRVLELEPWNEAAQNNLVKLDKMKSNAPEPKSPQEMYQEIQPLLNNGDPNRAIAALEALLQSYPDFALGHNDLGVLYYNKGDKERTREHYEHASRLMPENINFQKNLADFYCIELGRIEDALKIYVSILKTDPQDVETLKATGLICKALGKPDDARDFFKQVLEIDPCNADARRNIQEMERLPSGKGSESESAENAYLKIHQKLNTLIPTEAIVELEKLVILYPNFAIGHNDLGVLYYSIGNKEKAWQHYQQAVNLQPDNMTLQKNLADFLFIEQGRVEEALTIYVNILAANPNDIETLLITGHICAALKKFDDAKEFYNRVLTLEPDNEDAGKNFQALITSQSERSSARSDCITDMTVSGVKNESMDLDKENSEKQQDPSKTTVSIILSLDGVQNRVKECLKSIQMHTVEPHELLLLDRGATRGMLRWARQFVKDNDHYHIIECAPQAGWAESINRAIQKAKGDINILAHNDVVVPEGWLKAFIMCTKIEPNVGVVGPMSNRAGGLQQLVPSDESDRTEFESAAKAFSEQYQYRRVPARKLSDFCLAFRRELLDKIGYFDEQFFSEAAGVEDFCNRAASRGYQNIIAADTFVYHYNRHPAQKNASTINSVGHEDSRKFKEKWNGTQNPEIKAFRSALFLERANELSHKGQIDQAVDALLSAIGIQPEEQRFYLELAKVLLAAKRFQDVKDALMEMPSTVEHQEIRKIELLGYAEEGLENFAAARAHVEQVLAINPDRAAALNLKGILAYRNDDRHSAEKYFKRALASDPGYGEPYTNLGMLSLAADRPQDALTFFEKAFRLTPSDVDIANNYHSLIAEIGEYSKAEQPACEAAAIYPKNQKIKYMLIDLLIQQGKDEMAMAEIEDAILKFGFDDGILGASLKLREKLGPMTIKKSSKKAPVSLCMIIKDEEKYLTRCLASVKPIVDEMIIVDTGSADRSKDIAITFGAQVYDYQWENDFAAARNFSISKASGQWILILDGDEVISPLDYEHFNQIVSKKPKAPVAYSITTRNYSKLANFVGWMPNDGQYPDEEAAIGWLPSEKVRLFYGKDQIQFEGAVHELVDPVLERNGIKIKRCSIPVHHYGRLDKEKLNRKGEIYFDIGQKKLSEMGKDINALRELAIQATILHKNQQALELWKKLLALNPNAKLEAHAYVNLGTIYNRLGKFDDALDAGKKAVVNDPELKEARYNLAMAELHCGNAQNAIDILEDLLRGFPEYPPAQFILSAACCCAGQKEKGFDGIRKLKSSSLGAHLESPCSELAQSLLAANKLEYAFCVLGAAIEGDIVNQEILDLFAACIQMKDEAQKVLGITPTGRKERQPIKFENLPQ